MSQKKSILSELYDLESMLMTQASLPDGERLPDLEERRINER